MPNTNELLALAGYKAPEKPTAGGKLNEAQKEIVRTIIRAQLADGPMQYQRLRTRTVHFARIRHSLTVKGADIAPLVEEMREAGEFAPGYGGKAEAAAKPVDPVGELDPVGEPVDPKEPTP